MIVAYDNVDVPDALVFRFGTHGNGIVDPPLAGLQAIAHILRFGGTDKTNVLVTDLDCLKTRTSGYRPIARTDFSPETKELARLAWAGEALPSTIVIDSFGKLYQQTMVRVLSGLPEEKVSQFGGLLAGEALHQLVFDLEKAGKTVIVVTWVENNRPYMPYSLDRLVESVNVKENAA